MVFSLRHSVATRSMAPRRLVFSMEHPCGSPLCLRRKERGQIASSGPADIERTERPLWGALRKERMRLRRRSPKRAPFIFVRPLGVSETSVPLLVSATAIGFPLELRVLFRVEPANSARYVL